MANLIKSANLNFKFLFAFWANSNVNALLTGQTQKGFAVGAFFVNVGFAVPPSVFLPPAKKADVFGGIYIFLIFKLPAVDIAGESAEKVQKD